MQDSNIPKNIVITGASSGIGKELAIKYSALGAQHILLFGRNKERLEQTKKLLSCDATIAICSVTEQEKMEKHLQNFDQKFPVDLIIANAGISAGTSTGGESIQQIKEIFSTNIDGVVNSIYPLIDGFKKRKQGQIAIISSLSAFRGMPSAPAYSAAKACVKNLGEALSGSLKKDGIFVTTICPGFIKTPLTDVNKFEMPFLMNVGPAADKIIKAIGKKKIRYSFPTPMLFIVWLLAAMPIWLSSLIVNKLPKK